MMTAARGGWRQEREGMLHFLPAGRHGSIRYDAVQGIVLVGLHLLLLFLLQGINKLFDLVV